MMIKGLTPVVSNAAALAKAQTTNEDMRYDFAMIRRLGLGASDASAVLGISKWKTLEELIAEKVSTTLSEDEKKVGEMVSVRKGTDLESLIMEKFERRQNVVGVFKPTAMYRIDAHPQLTVNFDGVYALSNGMYVPVECKYVSPYAAKFWDMSKTIPAGKLTYPAVEVTFQGSSIEEHIQFWSAWCGIPDYYYTQVQQQILGLNAPFGYLAALWDKDWYLRTFAIPRDPHTIKALVERSEPAWRRVQELKGV